MVLLKLFITAALLLIFLQPASAVMPAEIAKAIRTGNFQRANDLLIPLAENNDAEALYQLGRLQQKGLIAESAAASPVDFLHRAAKLGHVKSAYLLANEYNKGTHVERDSILAKKWMQVAADEGHKLAIEHLKNNEFNKDNSQNRYTPSKEDMELAIINCDAPALRDFISTNKSELVGAFLAETSLALHKSVNCETSKLLSLLVETGVSVNQRDDMGNTALHLAVAKGDLEKSRQLLNSQASPSLKNEEGWTAVMLAERNSNKTIKQLLGVRKTPIGSRSADQLADAQNSGVHKGWSKLAIAAWKGDLALVKKLLLNGANPYTKDSSGFTPMYRAIERKEDALLEHMLNTPLTGTDVEAIKLLAKLDMHTSLKLMISNGTSVELFNEISLLNIALRNKSTKTASLLISNGVNTNNFSDGVSPLIIASQLGKVELTHLLLAHRANVKLADKMGCTALCWAIRSNSPNVALALLKAGASNHADNNGVTPLMLFAQAGWFESVEKVIAMGATVSDQSASGTHALILASVHGHNDIVKLLLQKTTNIDLADKTGDTALIAAVREDHQQVARLLIASGASVHAHNNRFESARSLADAKSDESWTNLFDQTNSFWDLLSGGR